MVPADSAVPSVRLRIGQPCDADWSRMDGDERRRHCAACGLGVVAYSTLRRDEAEQLVATHLAATHLVATHRARPAPAARLCIRAVVDAEGRPLTREQVDAARAARVTRARPTSRSARFVPRVAAALAAVLGLLGLASCSGREREGSAAVRPPDPVERSGTEELPVLMGEVCIDPEPAKEVAPPDSAGAVSATDRG